MKPTAENPELHRWLDGEMSTAEQEKFRAQLAADPALQEEAQFFQRLRQDLQAHLPVEMPVPYADFFNSQIQARIHRETLMSTAPAQPQGWLSWFRLPWLVPASLALALGMLLGNFVLKKSSDSSSYSSVQSLYTPDESIRASTYHSEDAQATVLMLDGLEEMPADRKIVGFNLSSSLRHEDLATTSLLNAAGTEVAQLTQNASQVPMLLTHR